MRVSLALIGLVAASLIGVACFSALAAPDTATTESAAPEAASEVATPLRLSIHYLDGLSARSSDKPPQIRFLHYGCNFSLLLTNTTKDEIRLWKPNCPEGDDAIRLEFKLAEDSKKVGTAQRSHVYTGGMGIPKTMNIAAGDSLVFQIDFSSYWSVPFVLKPGQRADLLVRAVYDSKPMHPARQSQLGDAVPDADKVWKGRIETDWQRVHIANVTEADAPLGHRGTNLLE